MPPRKNPISRENTRKPSKNVKPSLPKVQKTRERKCEKTVQKRTVPSVSKTVKESNSRQSSKSSSTSSSVLKVSVSGTLRIMDHNQSERLVITQNREHVATVSREVHPENEEIGDVVYLYSVDSSPSGRIIEEVDLSQDSQNANIARMPEVNPQPTEKKPTSAKNPKSRKRKLSATKEVSRKRINKSDRPQCSVCRIHCDSLVINGKHMLIANCGHLFCQSCAGGKGYKCESCGAIITRLSKLFF